VKKKSPTHHISLIVYSGVPHYTMIRIMTIKNTVCKNISLLEKPEKKLELLVVSIAILYEASPV
jgi:hypothetical protein